MTHGSEDWLRAFVPEAEATANRQAAARRAREEAERVATQRMEARLRANTATLIEARRRITEAIERARVVLANASNPGISKIEIEKFFAKGWYIEKRGIRHGDWYSIWLLDNGSVAFAPFQYPNGYCRHPEILGSAESAEKLTPTEWTIQLAEDVETTRMLHKEEVEFKQWVDEIVNSFALNLVTILVRQDLRP